MGWFAVKCHYTPDQVYEMPAFVLIRLTLLADDIAEAQERARQEADQQNRTTVIR